MDAHRIAEERSLAYHRAVAECLLREPARVDVARERVRDWNRSGRMHDYYAEAWLEVLGRPIEEITKFMIEDSERARALRQVTPFAGFLDPRERWRIWREVRERAE